MLRSATRAQGTHVKRRRFGPLPREVSVIGQGTWQIEEGDRASAIAALRRAGDHRRVLVCDQVLYHLKERAIEHAVLPWCEQHGLAVTAYSPFGHGDFPGPDTSGGRLLAGNRAGA